jgi:DNA-binding HxlR family transcriptional regulator
MDELAATDQLMRSMGRMCVEVDPILFRSVLDRVGDKWSLILIGLLEKQPLRFTDLLRTAPGISRRMLSLTLRALERDGLVTRTIYAEIPPRVEYEVTDLGRTLAGPVLTLARWAADHTEAIRSNRATFDQTQAATD